MILSEFFQQTLDTIIVDGIRDLLDQIFPSHEDEANPVPQILNKYVVTTGTNAEKERLQRGNIYKCQFFNIMFSGQAGKDLLEALFSNPHLEAVNFDDATFTEQCWEYLITRLEETTVLKNIGFCGVAMSYERAADITNAAIHSNIRTVDFDEESFNRPRLIELRQRLSRQTKLELSRTFDSDPLLFSDRAHYAKNINALGNAQAAEPDADEPASLRIKSHSV